MFTSHGIPDVNQSLPLLRRLLAAPTTQQMKHDSTVGFAFRTLQGPVRPTNQDRVLVASICPYSDTWQVGIVADGIGSMSRSGEAVELGLAIFLREFIRHTTTKPLEPLERLITHAFNEANLAVKTEFREKGGFVAAACVTTATSAVIAHVGDARIYGLGTDQDVKLLTQDDVLPGRSDLIQFVGIGSGFVPHVMPLPPGEYPYVLLATDGAYRALTEQQLKNLSKNKRKRSELVERLVEISSQLDGHDNATALLLQVATNRPPSKQSQGEINIWTPDKDWVIVPQNYFSAGQTAIEYPCDGAPLPERDAGRKDSPQPHSAVEKKNRPNSHKKRSSKNQPDKDHSANRSQEPKVMFLFDTDESSSQQKELHQDQATLPANPHIEES